MSPSGVRGRAQRPGQVLAEIDLGVARAELDAVAARKDACIVHDRTLDAFRAGASNQTEVDNARTLLAEVEAERERGPCRA